MGELAIRAVGLSKRYRIGELNWNLTLKGLLEGALRAPLTIQRPEYIWALQDVSFEIAQGETVGIIGRNGSGKTSLLRIIGRVTRPTSGYAEIRGRLGTLLGVGVGFHPELTGRENVYLSGVILGMRRFEIERHLEEIVNFAEVGRFLDTPVKHYSSGMMVRLGFAIGAHLRTDVLLLDEALAVGDLSFQRKCYEKLGELTRSGRTALLVTHSMEAIRRLCARVLWLERGAVRGMGPAEEVVRAYEAAVASGALTG